MKSHLYILGRTPLLAFWELKTFFTDVKMVSGAIAVSEGAIPISQLGGTVKIAQIVGHTFGITVDALAPYIHPGSTFGISMYAEENIPRTLLEDIKKSTGASRFVEAREGGALTSVVIEKKHIDELILVKDAGGYIVARTISVQPFEEWSKRDFGRPFADPKAGMLPPKVARMIVNIAGIGSGKTLLDPFCGMGTILAEALLMGWNVVGSDQSASVVEKARANVNWLSARPYNIFVSDATHVSEHVKSGSVDAIVTEPFMGNPDVNAGNVKNRIKGLEKLYIGCLKDWRLILRPKGIVVMALPEYVLNGKTYVVKKVIDMCENLGYTTMAGPIEYSRPQAVVKRAFYIWHT